MGVVTIFALLGCFVLGYLCGNINFARIFSRKIEKEDITEVGSKNPGAMNVLRTHGFGQAILTLAFEAIKVGVPALAMYFVFQNFLPANEDVAYFLTAFGGVLGHCFPVIYKFKGGKGVACTFGMFVFSPHFWWVSLIAFVICFLLFFFIRYGFLISLLFIVSLSIYSTIFFVGLYAEMLETLIIVLVLIWLNFLLIVFLHRKNFNRLFHGQENKINLAEKIFKKKKSEEVSITSTTDSSTNEHGVTAMNKQPENSESGQENVEEKNEKK